MERVLVAFAVLAAGISSAASATDWPASLPSPYENVDSSGKDYKLIKGTDLQKLISHSIVWGNSSSPWVFHKDNHFETGDRVREHGEYQILNDRVCFKLTYNAAVNECWAFYESTALMRRLLGKKYGVANLQHLERYKERLHEVTIQKNDKQ